MNEAARRWPVAALLALALLAVILGGCAPAVRAPVINRAPAGKGGGDWRPDTYTVQKGDTLWSIALEYGLDYKDLAAWNDIGNDYVIKVGQVLKLKPAADAVVTAPLKTPAAVTGAPVTGTPAPSQPFVKTQPKATKVPYSAQALAAATALPPASNQAKVASTPPASADKSTREPAPGGNALTWAWPAKGKVITEFDDAKGAKGIDIAGKAGQPVFAAGPGKVVYSGSGLRGYGKLIIIKHDKTYLSAYAHNSRLLVKEGQQVAKGQKIAEMGDTDASRVELHFEIRRLGKPVDPLKYLPQNGRS